ncbi:MAG: DUF4286 family protein [Endozoicomonas sp.]
MIIYEVNCLVDKNIERAFLSWLRQHIKEIVALDGFHSAKIDQLLEDDRLQEQPGSAGISVRYRLENQEALESYLLNHAPQLRQDGIERFGNQFTVYRRVLASISATDQPNQLE